MDFKHISIYDEEKSVNAENKLVYLKGKIDYYLHKDVYKIFLKYKVEYAKIMHEYEKKLDSELNLSYNRALTFYQSREQLYDKFGLELAYYIDVDSYCWDAMFKNEEENYEFRIKHNNKIFLCKK